MADEPDNSAEIDISSTYYPGADLTANEFEQFMVNLLTVKYQGVENLKVSPHEVIETHDGRYNLDATIRFTVGGMNFLVIAEAKRHRHPIKRDLVATLHSKVQSIGAHKGVLVTTAPFQSGAIAYATAHGIALLQVIEGRFTYIVHSADPPEAMSREQAAAIGIPPFVALSLGRDSSSASTWTTVVEPGDGEWLAANILGLR